MRTLRRSLSKGSPNKRVEQTGANAVGKFKHLAPAAHAQRYIKDSGAPRCR